MIYHVRESQPLSDEEVATSYRLLQSERLLLEAGFYQHSDGNWYNEPEAPGEND